jgi:nicotinate phosphoribosyltransferase
MSSDATSSRFSPALLTDLYELTMLQAYFEEQRRGTAVFSLFVRRLPERRNYLLACGLDTMLGYLETLRFDDAALAYLDSLGRFSDRFLQYLSRLRFTGDVYAVAEGTPLFASEPILEITAPIDEAQLVETIVMNQIHLQTLLASKASRVVTAAQGRAVVDFGFRRMHGIDAGIKGARAFHIAGIDATSNVAAGQAYGTPLSGTIAHSYIQAHESELDAFLAFARVYPTTVLLVDTYDTLEGVRNVVRLKDALGDEFRIRAIRLDSGDLAQLAFAARVILDDAGLYEVGIVVSGGLDEDTVAALVATGAPITGFGVGTEMGASRDVPTLDIVYKLVEYEGRARTKLSPAKTVLPGAKQIFRVESGGVAERDVVALRHESAAGRPLLRQVMSSGQRLDAGRVTLDESRRRAAHELACLPEHVRSLQRADPPYRVDISAELRASRDALARAHGDSRT